MKRFYLFLKFCFYSGMLLAMAGLGVGYYFFHKFSKDLPQLDSLKDYNPPVVSEVYADDGTKIGEFWLERRIVLKPNEIPKIVEQAIIAGEDQTFFEHSGIDYMGIFRAMMENLRAGQIVQGGSTITQQVVKSFLLTNERSYERKIKEAILAKRLEETFEKPEILYLYLNQIYLGNRAYGIEAAAENYFHKTARELNIAEAAMIAGLAKAPSKYDPIHNFKRAKERQEYVIDRLLEDGYISKEQALAAKKFALKLYKAPTDKEYNMTTAPWFVEEVRRMIIEKYGDKVPYTHGLKIYTTLDLKAQKAADEAVSKGLTELHKRHGYLGPIKNLPSTEHALFNAENHRRIYFASQEPWLYDPELTEEKITDADTVLHGKKMYQALVTAVDAKTRTVAVQVGKVTGKILPRDFGWARKRANMSSGFNDVMYINTPVGTLKVGDVIEVKLVDVANLDDKQKKNYPDGSTYFILDQTPAAESALFSFDPFSGYVKAVVGGKDYTKSEFNRATQAVRQTGSSFKPFVYASAIDKGYTPDTVIADAPLAIPDGPGKIWSPQNYGGGYMGPMPLRSALAQSRNVVAVRILLDVGVEYVTALMRKLGISTDIAKVYSMALGANDMKLSELSRAYGVFPTGGILPDLIYVKKMTDRFGNTLEENKPKLVKNFVDQMKDEDFPTGKASVDLDRVEDFVRKDLWTEAQTWIKKDRLVLSPYEEIMLYGKYLPEGYAMSPHTAYTMVNLLQGVVDHGTATRVKVLGRPAAGKTGTTNDLTDCWFMGFTPDLVAGVWTGYDQNITKVGAGETGGKAAAPIFIYYMQDYLKDKPIAKFETPKGVNLADLEAPVQSGPNDLGSLFSGGGTGGGGGADFFANDL